MNKDKRNDIIQIKGQFIFTAEDKKVPEDWLSHTYQEWKLFTKELPVIDVYNENNKWLGWCLGHPVVDGILEPERVSLKNPDNEFDPYADFYDRATGKWVLILVGAATKSIYLDSYGSK